MIILLLDIVALLATLAAGILLVRAWRYSRHEILGRDVWILLVGLTGLIIFRNTSNMLEWSGITGSLDFQEDYVELMLPVAFFLVLWTFRQHESRRELRESEEKYRSTVNSMLVGIFIIQDLKFKYVNPAMARMLGYTREEIEDKLSPMDAVIPAQRELIRRNAIRRASGEPGYLYEIKCLRKDGSVFDAVVHGEGFTYQGRPASVGSFLDITDRKRAEERFRLIAQVSSDLIYEWDSTNDTLEWFGDIDGLLGYQPGEVVRTIEGWVKLIHPDDQARIANEVERHRTTTEPIQCEYHVKARDGSWRYWSDVGVPVLDEDGKPARWIGGCLDITDRKLAEQERESLENQLRQAQKMEAIGQLAGGVAHDFNNILTAILGNAELSLDALRRKLSADDPALQGLGQIQQSAERAAALTRQLLVFSRRDITQPEELDLDQTLSEMEKMLQRLITEDIALEIVCGARHQYVRADAGQIEQIIMNLVVNARDAMPDGGQLTLETATVMLDEVYVATHAEARQGIHVVLAVSDTGCGMECQVRERAFEPFFTTKPAGQGTGLGLATVYAIVKRAGGHVLVYSEPGQGTTFKVYLPVIEAPTEVRHEAGGSDPLPSGDETILVCEDDETVRHLTVHLLEDAGYTVLGADSATDALKQAAVYQDPVHLLISDVIMPDINGRKLADSLTAQRPKLKTIFISGYTSNVIAHHGVLDEGVEFLEKPFSRRVLLQRVREALDKPSQEIVPAPDA
ncbi:MAG: PAS domain S-box protein [Planctomycetota bacterium]